MEPPPIPAELTGGAPAFGRASLAPVWQLNAYFLETLIECSRHPAWRGGPWERALGLELADVLPAVEQELSRSPVSLLDIGLSDKESGALLAGVGGSPGQSPPAFLSRERAIQLAQVSLTLAWTLARNDLVSTSIVFGVTRSQATAISTLGVHAIPALSEKLSSAVRPRWLGQPRIWQRLLGSSEPSTSARFAPLYVRVLQRQFADLAPATSATHRLRDT
jgi:hypothetical protein